MQKAQYEVKSLLNSPTHLFIVSGIKRVEPWTLTTQDAGRSTCNASVSQFNQGSTHCNARHLSCLNLQQSIRTRGRGRLEVIDRYFTSHVARIALTKRLWKKRTSDWLSQKWKTAVWYQPNYNKASIFDHSGTHKGHVMLRRLRLLRTVRDLPFAPRGTYPHGKSWISQARLKQSIFSSIARRLRLADEGLRQYRSIITSVSERHGPEPFPTDRYVCSWSACSSVPPSFRA